MKTFNYHLQGMQDRQVKKYYENADLILQMYSIIKKENTFKMPTLAPYDKRINEQKNKSIVYYMKPTSSNKNMIVKMSSFKQLITKLAAVFF